jgi:hypothetical protein
MPVDYRLYPANWKKEIRPAVLTRAEHKCERCGLRNYSVGHRERDGRFVGVHGNITLDPAGEGLLYPSLEPLTHKEARKIADGLNLIEQEVHYMVIVLTIAHLDHNPAHNDMQNLGALCQRCHLNYDRLDNQKRKIFGKNYLLNQTNLFHDNILKKRKNAPK